MFFVTLNGFLLLQPNISILTIVLVLNSAYRQYNCQIDNKNTGTMTLLLKQVNFRCQHDLKSAKPVRNRTPAKFSGVYEYSTEI